MTFEARGLRKELQGRVLYSKLEFCLQPGQTLCVRGPSGSGKSQLLRQLAGLDANAPETQTGEVLFDGRHQDDWSPFEWRTEVCFVPQHAPRLIGTPVEFADRIAHFREQRTREGDDPLVLATNFGLKESQWGQPWTELSVGERQRMLLAVLLARRPSVLLLDEPTAALDPEATHAVEEALSARTCIWVTHDGEQAKRVATTMLRLTGASHAD